MTPLRFQSIALMALLALVPVKLAFGAVSGDTDSLLREAQDFRQRQQLTSAYDSAKKALKAAKGSCQPCQHLMVDLLIEMDRPHEAADSAASWAEHAGSPQEKATAHYREAQALVLEEHAKHNESLLKRADQALAHAETENPADPGIRLLQGRVLAALKKEAEAKTQFQACLSAAGATPMQCRRADAYIKDMALTQNEEAPEFTVTGPDGKKVTLDSLAGKVVMIDFWATWCGPCMADRSYVKSIAVEFEDRNFVLLGISGDEKESVWSKYVEENRMRGIQVRDERHTLRDLFHVSGIPTYIILDGNGLVRFRTTGALKDLRSRVRELVGTPPTTQTASATAGN